MVLFFFFNSIPFGVSSQGKLSKAVQVAVMPILCHSRPTEWFFGVLFFGGFVGVFGFFFVCFLITIHSSWGADECAATVLDGDTSVPQ